MQVGVFVNKSKDSFRVSNQNFDIQFEHFCFVFSENKIAKLKHAIDSIRAIFSLSYLNKNYSNGNILITLTKIANPYPG